MRRPRMSNSLAPHDHKVLLESVASMFYEHGTLLNGVHMAWTTS